MAKIISVYISYVQFILHQLYLSKTAENFKECLSCVFFPYVLCISLSIPKPGFLPQWSYDDLGSERSPGVGNGNPLQYSRLENPMDWGAWQATVHGGARVRHDLATKPPPRCLWCSSWCWLYYFHITAHFALMSVSISTPYMITVFQPVLTKGNWQSIDIDSLSWTVRLLEFPKE